MFKFRNANNLTDFLKGPRYIPGKFKDKFDNVFYFPDQVSFAWTYNELFDKQIYFFDEISTEKDVVIIDCGANIGISLIYLKMVLPQSKIIAFEPDPFLFDYLTRNIKANHLTDIEVLNKAVWSEETRLGFYQEKSDSGRLNIDSNMEISNSALIQVETCLLSNYITDKVDFLKIDIEGAEWEVIQEIEKKIKSVKRVFIESHSFINKEQDLHKILNLLSKNDFRYYITEGAVASRNPFLIKKKFLNMDLQVNIHAFRED